MARTVFIGDYVKTPDGEGYVEVVNDWREKIEDMLNAEATEFSRVCQIEAGDDFQESWFEVYVRLGRKLRRYHCRQVSVVEKK